MPSSVKPATLRSLARCSNILSYAAVPIAAITTNKLKIKTLFSLILSDIKKYKIDRFAVDTYMYSNLVALTTTTLLGHSNYQS